MQGIAHTIKPCLDQSQACSRTGQRYPDKSIMLGRQPFYRPAESPPADGRRPAMPIS